MTKTSEKKSSGKSSGKSLGKASGARGKSASGLADLRKRIDAIDSDILKLLNRRAGYAVKIASVKENNDPDKPRYRPGREAELLRRIVKENKGPLVTENIETIFREVMSACRALEVKSDVAYLGPSGTFTEEAAYKHFGSAISAVGTKDIADVFHAVESGKATYGVVPVENSIEGMVTHTLDRFIVSPLKVVGEVQLAVKQNLLSKSTTLKQIKKVFAHTQALSQCRRWLLTNMPNATLIEVSSSGEAAKRASKNKMTAAIAGVSAARHYDIPVLAREIEDEPDNTTRFLVIGEHDVPRSGDDKTSLLASLANRPGALLKLLEPLSDNGISMTRIESRPAGSANWEYVFFFDIEGHRSDKACKKALEQLEKRASFFKLLGSYPRAII